MNDARLTRRTFCGLCAAGTAAIHCREARAAQPAPHFALRYTLACSLFGCTKLEEILPEVRKVGAVGIDLLRSYPDDQREQVGALGPKRFAELLRQHNVRLDMTTRFDLGPFGLHMELGFLADFGAKLVVTGSAGPRDLTGPECKKAVRQFIERMKPSVAEAESHGVTIAIENHPLSLLSTPDSLRYLVELSKSPYLGIAFAPSRLPQDEKLQGALIEDLGPRLVHFSAGQYGRGWAQRLPKAQELEQMPGRGNLNFRLILGSLRKVGYAGAVEIFMHPVPGGDPIMETTSQVTEEINHARYYLEQCLGSA
jgi:sugar phosphate isomerase/epimerase